MSHFFRFNCEKAKYLNVVHQTVPNAKSISSPKNGHTVLKRDETDMAKGIIAVQQVIEV